MSLYNEDLVNSKIISNELNKINIKKVLESRVDIIKNTGTILNSKSIVTIYALDNYICKCISEHNINQYVKDYCKIINEQLLNTPYLIYDLPIRKIDVEYLSNYIPNVKSAFVKCSLYEKEIDIINEKYEKGFLVSKSELNKLIKYLFVTANYENSSKYIKKYDKLIKEILYHKSKLGFNAIGLIYKLYGYDFLRKLKLDSVTITFGNIKLDEITFGMNSNNVIIINKNIFDKINFITGSLDESDFYNYSALIGLQVVFHEITHSYQFSESKKNSYTNETFYTDTKEIININDKRDYRRNYDMQYTENQAQHFGWKMTSDFIGKYYGKNNSFFNKAVEYANMHYLKELFDKKYNIIGRKFYTGDYINKNLNKYFKNNPEKLKNVYSNFTMFYDEKGNPKSLMSILSNYPIKEEYSEFYYSYYLGRVIKGESLEKSKLQELNIVELETLKNNFIKLLNMSYKKLELINKYINSKMIIKNIGKATLVNNARVIYGISKRAYDSLMYLNKTYIGFITYDEMSLINDTYNKINCNEAINLLGLNNREGKHYGRRL